MNAKPAQKVDRNSPMPVYQQIAADIASRISQEEWCIGDKIPSENELTDEYSASRVTIRQALAKLEDEGLIEKQRGRGAFVKSNPTHITQNLYLPQVGMEAIPKMASADIQLSVVTNASQVVTSHLQVPAGTPLVYLQRSFLQGKKIIGINQAWFPLEMVPDMAEHPLINDSISDTLLERYGIHFGSVENYIESLILDARMSNILGTTSPSPALKINSIYTTEDGRPVEYSLTIWNGKDTRFHVQLSSK